MHIGNKYKLFKNVFGLSKDKDKKGKLSQAIIFLSEFYFIGTKHVCGDPSEDNVLKKAKLDLMSLLELVLSNKIVKVFVIIIIHCIFFPDTFITKR